MIGGDFPINVNFQGQTITFNVHPDDWISSLAWKIEDWSKKVRAHNLDIYFNGNLLNFLTTIQYNEITHNSTIVVKEKDVGIMPPPPPPQPRRKASQAFASMSPFNTTFSRAGSARRKMQRREGEGEARG